MTQIVSKIFQRTRFLNTIQFFIIIVFLYGETKSSTLHLKAEKRNFFELFSWGQGKSDQIQIASKREDFKLSTNPDDIHFYFYPDPFQPELKEEFIYKSDKSLHKYPSHLKSAKPFKFLIHGFLQNAFSQTFPGIVKEAYLKRAAESREEYNIFTVDWGKLSGNSSGSISTLDDVDYLTAMKNVEIVGKRVGDFISYLLDKGIVQSLNNVHLIGFSLGSHVAGTAGATLRRIYDKKVARITGLDPAGPGFYAEDLSSELKNEDTEFLDVIHTSQGTYGTWTSVGHIEFFPNGGGPIQPQCLNVNESKDFVGKCSHESVGQYYAYSITHPQLKARECPNYLFFKLNYCDGNSYATFGEFVETSKRGKYFFDFLAKK